MGPTISGYLGFIRARMRITATVLPDDSEWIPSTYDAALRLTNESLIAVPGGEAYPSLYAQAVYNLAGDFLINWATDLDGADPVEGSNPPMPYFEYMRKQYNTLGFTSGVVQSTGNDASNVSLQVPEQLQSLTVADLQALKTPWGRAYVGIAQQYGPTIWGLS